MKCGLLPKDLLTLAEMSAGIGTSSIASRDIDGLLPVDCRWPCRTF